MARVQLVRCKIKPSLKGALFKVLAAAARDPELVPLIWNFLEESQVNSPLMENGENTVMLFLRFIGM